MTHDDTTWKERTKDYLEDRQGLALRGREAAGRTSTALTIEGAAWSAAHVDSPDLQHEFT